MLFKYRNHCEKGWRLRAVRQGGTNSSNQQSCSCSADSASWIGNRSSRETKTSLSPATLSSPSWGILRWYQSWDIKSLQQVLGLPQGFDPSKEYGTVNLLLHNNRSAQGPHYCWWSPNQAETLPWLRGSTFFQLRTMDSGVKREDFHPGSFTLSCKPLTQQNSIICEK